MDAREEILHRIRQAKADLLTSPASEAPRKYLRQAVGLTADNQEVVTKMFIERLKHYGAKSFLVSEPQVTATINSELDKLQTAIIPTGFPEPWIPKEWAGKIYSDNPPLGRTELNKINAIISTCTVAIAESATVILNNNPGEGRRAPTLLPDYHICVLRADQIVSSLPEALPKLDPLKPVTFISGPSATVDIEMVRVQGVHGPRNLSIVIVT